MNELIILKALSKSRHTMQGVGNTCSEKRSLTWIDLAIKEAGFSSLGELDEFIKNHYHALPEIKPEEK